MATITKPIITDETGQDIVEALEQQILSITDYTGQDIVDAINQLRLNAVYTTDVIDDLTSINDVAPLSANQGRLLNNMIANLWSTLYPVGAIYITANNTSPANFLGGTWIQISNKTVIDAVSTSTYWYRIYSDGWIEQGGNYGAAFSSWTLKSITFPKPFRDNTYSVQVICGNTAQLDSPGINVKTPTYFSCTVYNSTGNANWYACGYGATQQQTQWYWKRTA